MKSMTVTIFIAGDYHKACNLCAEWFGMTGGCATVTPTYYIYTGGREAGVAVGLINYPPHPSTEQDLMASARELAEFLRADLGQRSYTIQGPLRVETVGR